MDAISQTTFSSAFSWMKMFEYRLKFHWSLFLRVQLTISQHWFRKWLGADQATSHYLDQWWLDYQRIYASLGLNELMVHWRWASICSGNGLAPNKRQVITRTNDDRGTTLRCNVVSHWLGWGGWGCEVSCGGHHRQRGKTTTGSALDGAVLDFTQTLAYLVHDMSRSQLYLGFGHFGWFPSFFGNNIWRVYGKIIFHLLQLLSFVWLTYYCSIGPCFSVRLCRFIM